MRSSYLVKDVWLGGGVRIASRQPFVRRRDGQEEVGLGLRSGYI